ncbi:PREDICTED: protein CASC1 isoform X3 [Crocodylus porosus]|uniref:protein CASC1 isoform X3 n=1 Tax=Crocodylus porosus TaxID=8502 RepID=UPI00093DEFCA|nr:PREDICTED: protein CASC1 isoform X3 [Crocodylus porosus]
MGPKKKKKSGGKKKLSKAERIRIQKEEEERRLKEEEEARLRAEQEEAERFEKERLEQEKREKLEAKDQERRGSELTELHALEENFLSAMQWKEEYRAYAKWEHYIGCDGSPDPAVPQEINTFMSLWREDQNKDIEFVIEKGNKVLNLINKLDFLLLDTPLNELPEKNVIQYQESILDLQSLLHQKYNEATENLLKKANTYADSDSGNMAMVIKDKNVTFCIWANLKKNPRFKNHTFCEADYGFDLPKSLAVSDVAVRILHTHYDHVSPLHHILPLHLMQELSKIRSDLVLEVTEEEKEKEEGERKSEKESDLANEEESYSPGGKSGISFKEDSKSDADENEMMGEEPDKKSESFNTVSQVQISTLQEETNEKEEEIIDENIVDLRQFAPLGGVYHIDALKLPPQAKQVKGWIMVELLDMGLETYPYPPESEESKDVTYPQIGITVQLLDTVIYFEEPTVARWDTAGKQWRTDGISNINYKMEEKQVSFEMDSFYTVALLQDLHLNMPYQSWELRPTDIDELFLTVVTAFAEVQIQIKGNQCMLSSIIVEKGEVLSYLTGRWTTPVGLTIALKKAGVNIFPAEYSHKYVYVNKKTPLAEIRAYQQMALSASAFAFSWSKWNLESGEDQVVFKVSEHLNQDLVKDEDWSLYMFNGQRAQRLKISETSEAFSEELAEETEFHSTFYHMIKDFASEQAIERVKKASYLFTDVVYQLLLGTRVLTYS